MYGEERSDWNTYCRLGIEVRASECRRALVQTRSYGKLVAHLIDGDGAAEFFRRFGEPVARLFVGIRERQAGHACFCFATTAKSAITLLIVVLRPNWMEQKAACNMNPLASSHTSSLYSKIVLNITFDTAAFVL